ncbi:MAG TPA: TolC family protein [Polyangiaceae bacterium]|nr:TolC family protein [Polyangiaceae bacterium]
MQAARWLASFVVGCSLFSSSARAQALDEVAATRAVCLENAVARAQRQRGDAAVLAAQVLPNPVLIVEHQLTLAGAADRETILGLSLPLGIGGRRWLLQDAADARRQQAFAEAHATTFEAALAFREAFVAASVDQAGVEVLSQQQAALDALSETLQKLAKGGEAASYDGLRQSTQARVHRQLLASAKAKALASRTLLEAWTGHEVTLQNRELVALGGGRASSFGTYVRETPAVQSFLAEARAGDLEARAARRRAVPDLAVFAGYRAVAVGSETGHGVALSLEMPLTFFDHGQAEAANADAEVQVARSLAARLRQQMKAKLKAARASLTVLEASHAEADTASRDALLVREKAAQLYAAGEASITELLEAFRVAEEAQLAKVTLGESIALTRLALMRAAGTMFDATLDRDCRGVAGGVR